MSGTARRSSPIRVLIVDDHIMMRNGLTLALHPYPDIEVVGTAASGPLAVAATAQLHPDVVLMDLRMPGGDGIEATRDIVASDRDTAVIVLTTYDVDEDIYQAIDAGAAGYLLKDIDPSGLAGAVRAAAAGEQLLDAHVVSSVFAEFRRRRGRSVPIVAVNPLTERQRAIIRGIADGKTNREIARELVMEPGGIKSAIARLLTKNDLKTRAQLGAWASRNGFLD